MLDHYIGNVFIYIGKFANYETITVAMIDAEFFYFYMHVIKENNLSWRKVSVL